MKRFTLIVGYMLLLVFATVGRVEAINLITNGNFEDGLNYWNPSGDVTLYEEHNGNHWAWLGRTVEAGDSLISQKFNIEVEAPRHTLAFDWWFGYMDYNDIDPLQVDVFAVNINTSEMKKLASSYAATRTYDKGHFEMLLANPLDLGEYVLKFSLSEAPFRITSSWAKIDNVVFDVPEPSAFLLLGSGLIGMAVFGRRKFNS